MICCLLHLPVAEQRVLNSPTLMQICLFLLFSSENFSCFAHFGVILLDINLGMLCLPGEVTIFSNTFVLKHTMSDTVSDAVCMQFTWPHYPKTIGMG